MSSSHRSPKLSRVESSGDNVASSITQGALGSTGYTYKWLLRTLSWKLPWKIFGVRLSFGIWWRLTTDIIALPSPQRSKSVRQYQYDELHEGQIRVLDVLPGQMHEPLRTRIRKISLDPRSNIYEAVSYVWGASNQHKQLDVGDGEHLELEIMPNVEVMLHYLRSPDTIRTLWIDAICINQQNIDERAQQVPLMAQIYSTCTSVLVWLGEPTSHTQAGLDILNYLSHGPVEDVSKAVAPWEKMQGNEVADALNDILKRPYFVRVWVVQEVALAPRIIMQVGSSSISWTGATSTKTHTSSTGLQSMDNQTVRRFIAHIKLAELSPSWTASGLDQCVNFGPFCDLLTQGLFAAARRRGEMETASFLDIVHSLRGRKVTDPRDRVYGVMSLLTEQETGGLMPDYRMSWEEAYWRFYDVVKRLLG